MKDLWLRRLKTAGVFALAVLAAVSGFSTLIFGLAQDGTARLALAGIGIVLFSPVAYLFVAGLIDVGVRFRDYQKLLDAPGQVRESLKTAEGDLAELPDKLAKERLRGQLEALGAMTANTGAAIPTLSHAKFEDGLLTFYGNVPEGHVPPMGSRYLLQSVALGTRRGILAVARVKDETSVILEVREKEDEGGRFWDAAIDRAQVHEAVPENVTLVPDPLLQELRKKVE